MANKKRRKQKLTAQASSDLHTVLLTVLSGLITAALAKLFGLN